MPQIIIRKHGKIKKPKFNFLKYVNLDEYLRVEIDSKAGTQLIKNFLSMFVQVRKGNEYLAIRDDKIFWVNNGDYILKDELENILETYDLDTDQQIEVVALSLNRLKGVPFETWLSNIKRRGEDI